MPTSSAYRPLKTTGRILMGPGPSMVHARVYEALSRRLDGHLDPEFLALMNETQEMLREVLGTKNRLTISVSGTGSAGMEAALVNLVEPDDEVLVCVNGVFGGRMCEIVERIGGRLQRIERPWGEVFAPEDVRGALEKFPAVRVVAVVNAETSTGAHQPIREIGMLCREREKLLVVDAVTSLGGTEVLVDDWAVDVCYSATQKCLSCPPGLSPITFSDRAVERIRARKKRVTSWYLDMGLIESYWTEGKRAYHHTAPISMNYALHQALAVALEEGLAPRYERHRQNSAALMAGLEALGFLPFAREGRRLSMLNAVRLPEGVEDARVRRALLEEYNIEIGGGLGAIAGKVWRIGLMGESSSRENVTAFLSALESILFSMGARKEIGPGLEAAAGVYRGGA
ncbi:MAG TPA: alanine--glyoxylate aminotransferase family protein [Planctomycetota bacterium]|nr:alanine--glyoxylate aminotransferase family protein [Planctomycetota bacterium]